MHFPNKNAPRVINSQNFMQLYFLLSDLGYTEENHPSLEAAEAKYPGVPVFITGDTETIAVIKQLYREG